MWTLFVYRKEHLQEIRVKDGAELYRCYWCKRFLGPGPEDICHLQACQIRDQLVQVGGMVEQWPTEQ